MPTTEDETTDYGVRVKFSDLSPGERFCYSSEEQTPYGKAPALMKLDAARAVSAHNWNFVFDFADKDQAAEVVAIDRRKSSAS